MPETLDKTECCVSFIVECLSRARSIDGKQKPLFIGLNGAQGSGKTTLVSSKPTSKTINAQRVYSLRSLYLFKTCSYSPFQHARLHFVSLDLPYISISPFVETIETACSDPRFFFLGIICS